ncbi:MAG: hypothetical protein M3353_06500 [Actinomycetota bacterium]|nr:hypothetical protein [Actinomycetota bacterium]
MLAAAVVAVLAGVLAPGVASPASDRPDPAPDVPAPKPHFTKAVAFDESPALRTLARRADTSDQTKPRLRDRGGSPRDSGFTGDPVVQSARPSDRPAVQPIQNFDGLRNQDNFNLFGFRVNPPDPVGDVGRSQYVEMVNLAFAVYSKTGETLLGPTPIGALWEGFKVRDCTDPSGDPIVIYDQLADRWILSQFTIRGFFNPNRPFFNCVAVSKTADATGGYYRYAFSSGFNFPDYPKYGVWTDAYTLTTREFGPNGEYGIGVYGLEKRKMLQGLSARAVSFFIDGNDPDLLPLVGDGLLPADLDGARRPADDAAIPVIGTQDDGGGYGATTDAVNIWDFRVDWGSRTTASLHLQEQIRVRPFDSIFPCGPDSRDCLQQPGQTNSARFIDILSYRQRPTWRLAYRQFPGYDSMVTNQSVEAARGVAGVRWYEIRRSLSGDYSVFQQGTYAPSDGIDRWMGSIAQDKLGNMALGYSVVNGTDIFPGIRFTGRSPADPPGVMTVQEGTIINGRGLQQTRNSRWGDYTSMNVDPVDDCTFWYVNEYYSDTSQVGWRTRIASFRLPGC